MDYFIVRVLFLAVRDELNSWREDLGAKAFGFCLLKSSKVKKLRPFKSIFYSSRSKQLLLINIAYIVKVLTKFILHVKNNVKNHYLIH